MIAKILTTLLGLTLVLAVACGSAAPPAPEATTAPAAEPTAAPVQSETAQPTAAPQMADPPADVEVNPGKVTWMIGNFGNERFDPTFSNEGNDYGRLLHAHLISSDVKEGRRVSVPGIATKWDISGDGLTWTLTIREGVKFHDGTDLTAEDVMWTLQHIFGPQAKEYAASPSTPSRIMDQIEQTGPDQVSVTTKIPILEFPVYIAEAGPNWQGVVLPKRATLHNEEEEAAYDLKPIGAGIVRLVKHVPADSMTFERFADYYYQPKNGFPEDKRVNFTVLDLRLVPEESTRVAALRAGEADIAPVSLQSKEQVEAGGGRLVFGEEGVILHIYQLGCWKEQFPCHDKRVRQALNYAIDKELMRDKLFGGPEVMQVNGWFAVTRSTLGYSPELDPYPFDPVKARQLLAEAGYPGGKGFGKLVINTWVSASVPLLLESAQLGAEFWKRELGLEVEVKVGDKAALRRSQQLTEDLHGQVLWTDNETRVDATSIMRSYYGDPNSPRTEHHDPELFALLEKALAVSDPVEREKVLNSMYRRMRDEAYNISLGYVNIPWGVGPRILTWEPYPLAFYPSAIHTITLK
jgi:peptide/nickel transport system substrate-binding protein